MSDAAPLPRQGEVFFDVRGNSRSMRLSWYADTGVAVFSIWQAGMCTGTFRLPIGDLRRMIDTLERGPSAQGRGRGRMPAAGRGSDRGRDEYPVGDDEIGQLDSHSAPGGYAAADYAADYSRSDNRTSQHARGAGGAADYPAADYGSAGYGGASRGDTGHGGASYGSGPGQYGEDHDAGRGTQGYGSGPGQYGDDHDAGRGTQGYGSGPGQYGEDRDAGRGTQGYGSGPGQYGEDHDAGRGTQAYGSPAYPPDGAGGYRPADFGPGQSDHYQPPAYDYDAAGHGRGGEYPAASYGAAAPDTVAGEHRVPGFDDVVRADTGADYPPAGYGSQPASPAGSHRRDDSPFSPDPAGPAHAGTDEAGYLDERFVPPYVRGGGESYPNDNRAGAAGYAGDPDDPRYRSGEPQHSQPDGYDDPQWRGEAYSSGAEYRRR